MKSFYRILLILITILIFTGCDQTIKKIAQEDLKYSQPLLFLDGMVRFQYAENPGIILGIGSNLPKETRFIFFVVFTSIALLLFLIYITFTKKENKLRILSYSIILSGGLGNLIDRIRNDGRVIDYIMLGSSSIHTAIFNLADVFVICGMTLLIYTYISKRFPDNY